MQESELTPTASNLLDGRYAVFGYIVDNEELLQVRSSCSPCRLLNIRVESKLIHRLPGLVA